MFDLYTIIFLALAVFIFVRLRSVLGSRTGRERPPYDPYSAPDPAAKPTNSRDKVVTLPGRAAAAPQREDEAAPPATERWAGIAEPGSAVAVGLDAVAVQDREFDIGHFLSGAKSAYEMIVTAFAEGDTKALRNLLAKDVYDGFAAAIAERDSRGEKMETRFVAIEKTEVAGAELKGKTAQIVVRFVSQLVSVTKNSAGETVDGSPDRVTDVTDIWTFAREIGARDPNWKLVATEFRLTGRAMNRHGALAALLGVSLLSIDPALAAAAPLRIAETELEPVAFEQLDGWAAEDHLAALAAFRASCVAVRRRAGSRDAGRNRQQPKPIEAPLNGACEMAAKLGENVGPPGARRFFETAFRPVRISKLGERDGFLTGYYEPEVEGRRKPGDGFTIPMYAQPAELVAGTVKKKAARIHGFPNRGKVGHRVGKKLVEYHDRAAIEDGALKDRGLEICWLKDPIDAFFIHIQGSARVRLEDGKILRLNYAAHNGHTYLAVGRVLADRGVVPRAEMTMDKIRAYFAETPDEAREIMRMNKSFVFFREVVELAADAEAVGAQGLPLTRERSIAVDRAIHAYGTPFWIEAELPLQSETTMTPFRRLMLAQDTGSAIVGPARADVYFGAGIDAGTVAGRLKHAGRFFMLVPRTIDPALGAEKTPLPRPRPKP